VVGKPAAIRRGAILRKGTSYSFHAVLWGYGWHTNESDSSLYSLILATSPYRVPEIITTCASDTNRAGYLYSSRRFGRGGSWSGTRDYTVVFDNGNSNLRRDTYVTPDYSMGTFTLDMNRNYISLIDQNRVMGVMFASGVNDRIMVFGKGGSEDTSKSFADISGVTRDNCMVVQRDKNADQDGDATQLFLCQTAWDNRVESGGWLFTQLDNAYCAIRPAGGGYTSGAVNHGVNLTIGEKWAPVIIQTGQADNYADFAAFQSSVMNNALTYAGGAMNYTSEAGDVFTFYANSKTTPKVNGTTVNLNPDKTYDSPYLSMVHGEEVATVSYPGYDDLKLNFSLPPVISKLTPANNASNTPLNTALVATFSEPVQAGSGSITLKKRSDDSTVATFDVTDSSAVRFEGTKLSLILSNNLQLDTAYYIEIPESAVQDRSGTPYEGFSGNSQWSFSATDTESTFLVNSASKVVASKLSNSSTSFAFDANADMIIVAVSTERSNGDVAVRYDGHTLSNAVDAGTAGIWYLDLTQTDYAGGSATLEIDFTDVDVVNGVGVGVVSVSANGVGIDLHATKTGTGSLVLNTTRNETFNVVSFNANHSGNPSVNAPLTKIYASGAIGSAKGAAGYQANTPAGDHTYSWTTGDKRAVAAASFVVRDHSFSGWAERNNLGEDSNLDDDPDEDDVPNGIEAFFGSNPNEASPGGLIALRLSGTQKTLTHPQSDQPPTDLQLSYSWSIDLADWYDCDGIDGPDSGETVDVSSEIVDGTATVTVTPSDEMGCLFLRAKVQEK